MKTLHHAFLNGAVGLVAKWVWRAPIKGSWAGWLVSWLVDVDHFLYFVLKRRRIKVREFLEQIKKDYYENVQRFYLFHTLEFGVVISVVVYRSDFLTWPVAVGFWLHLAGDAARNIRTRRDFKWLGRWCLAWEVFKRLKEVRRYAGVARG